MEALRHKIEEPDEPRAKATPAVGFNWCDLRNRSRHNRRDIDVHLAAAVQDLEYRAIARRIADDKTVAVLDWGCGFGQMSRLLRDHGLNVSAFGYNPTIDAPRAARLERFPEIEALQSPDPVALPYPDRSFDAVLSCGVLEHVRDPEKSLVELARVLKPRGTLYVYKLPNRYSYLELVARRMGLYYHGEYPDDRVYTLRTAEKLLSGHGFDVLEKRRANMLPLTVHGKHLDRHARAVWAINRGLARVPGLNLLATNVEVVARLRDPSAASAAEER